MNEVFKVGILPIPGFALMSYACTVEPLRAANLLSSTPKYEIINFGEDDWTASSGSAAILNSRKIGEQPQIDLLLVIAGGNPFEFRDEACFAWLRKMARNGVRIGGVSGGAVILANAGLMEERRMTVHWEHAAMLSEQFPDAVIERRLYVIDRDRVTCGGGTAPLDLMHALIASHHGPVFAHSVSDWFLHTDVRNAGAPQRGESAERVGSNSPHVLQAVKAMEDHIADPLNLKQIALVADVSPRHLNRLFKDTTGLSTMEYYRQLRLSVAKRLVRDSSMGIAEIAETTGFSSAGHFSNLYQSVYSRRPLHDRRSQPNP